MKPPARHSRTKPWSQPLADLVGAAIDPVLVRQGFAEHDLILNWEDLVGERLAANSRPIKLQWPRRPAAGSDAGGVDAATLVIRVEGSFALDLQHMAEQVLARVNAHLGWRCVGKLALRQGPIDRLEPRRIRTQPPSPAALAAAAAALPQGTTEALTDALTRLGAHVAKSHPGS